MLNELLIFCAAIVTCAAYGWLSARFYLRITAATQSVCLHRLRTAIAIAGWVLPAITVPFASVLITHYLGWTPFFPVIIARGIVIIAFIIFVSLFIAPFAGLLHRQTRNRALSTREARLIRLLVLAVTAVITIAAKIALHLARSYAASKPRRPRYKAPNPWGHHGYESYDERHRRRNGGPY